MYGAVFYPTARAWVAEIDGDPAAIAGYYIEGGNIMVFSDLTEEMRKRPVSIMKESRKFMNMLTEYRMPCVCVADPDQPGAERFLRRLGWSHVGKGDLGEVYAWHS